MRGRPRKALDEQKIRKDLLAAAASCLSDKSYSTVSIREIAAAAGVNSAMISYYFEGKQGLIKALLNSLFEDPQIQQSLIPNLKAVAAKQRSQTLVVSFLSLTHQHPWLFRMIVDDLTNRDEEMRKLLATTVAGESNRLFDEFLQLQIEEGYFKGDINRELAKVSLLSLMAFPFLASPILKQAYQVDIEEIRKGQLVNHVVTTFEASLLAGSV